jgi:hypothetical protein
MKEAPLHLASLATSPYQGEEFLRTSSGKVERTSNDEGIIPLGEVTSPYQGRSFGELMGND